MELVLEGIVFRNGVLQGEAAVNRVNCFHFFGVFWMLNQASGMSAGENRVRRHSFPERWTMRRFPTGFP